MKINLVRRPESLATEIYLYEKSPDNRTITSFSIDGGEVTVTTNQYNIGQLLDVKPLMVLQESDARAFVQAVVEYAREEGFKAADESHTKGKLEATERHLIDMRTLLKLK